jgi:hypothetical protein
VSFPKTHNRLCRTDTSFREGQAQDAVSSQGKAIKKPSLTSPVKGPVGRKTMYEVCDSVTVNRQVVCQSILIKG